VHQTSVAIVWWPEEASSLPGLRASGVPRLLLVAPDAMPPRPAGPDEDWIRRPAPEADVAARVSALAARSEGSAPEIGAGRLRYRGRWVSLSQTEEAISAVLARAFGDIVPVEQLTSAGGRKLSPEGIRVHLTRLRKRLRPLGLVVRPVRGRGYVLDDVEHAPVG
jgi:two-component system OmpR family response regulator